MKSQTSQGRNDEEAECELEILSNVQFEHDYVGSNGWWWNEYRDEVVTYIAGAIVRSIKNTLKCEMCLEQIESDEISSNLIKLKNRVSTKKNEEETTTDCRKRKQGLTSPSNDVIAICKTAEKVIRSTHNLVFTKNVLQKLIFDTKKLLSTLNLFPRLDIFIEKTVETNQKLDLINLIL